MQSIGHAQLRCQPLAVEFIGKHAVDDGPQKRAFVQRRPARNVQRGTGKLLAHGRQCPDDGVQVFQRVVALGQKQYRRAAKLPRTPQRPGVKQGAQRLVAGVVAGGGGQVGGGAAVKAGAAGDAAGLAQNGGFFLRQNVKISLHVVQQFAGNDLINGVPQSAGMAVGAGHAVAQVRRAVPHHALDADEHRQVRRILHGGGFGVLGAPDLHKVGLLGLQQGGKTIGTGQDAVAYAVLLPLQGCFLAGIGAGYGQAQFPVGAQRCQLAGEPTAAYIAGTCQPAGSRRLRQYSFYKPEDVHKG